MADRVKFVAHEHCTGEFIPMGTFRTSDGQAEDQIWIDGTLTTDKRQAELVARVMRMSYELGRRHVKEETLKALKAIQV